MQPYSNTRINGAFFAPALRNRSETLQHGVAGSQRFGGAAAAFASQAESGHDSIARHVIYLAAELIRRTAKYSEEFVQERDDLRSRQALHHAGIAS
jgi:hypothetical protein